MTKVHKRRFLFLLLSALVISLAVATVRARWPEPKKPHSLQIIGSVLNGQNPNQVLCFDDDETDIIIGPPAGKNQTSSGGLIHYFADGCSLSDPASHNRQANWVCMFNPNKVTARLKFTFYYEDAEPTYMEYEVPPETARSINLYKRDEVLKNHRFGAKIKSSVPMVIQITTGYYGISDKEDWFTRAMHSIICNDSLSRINYYADGTVLDKEGLRLKEREWVFLLNPNQETAKVMFYIYGNDGGTRTYTLNVPPNRLHSLDLDDLVAKNKLFGTKFVSNVPIAIQQTRLAEEEDGKTIRSAYSVMAKPWTEPVASNRQASK